MFEALFRKYVNFKNITFALVAILFLFFIFNCKDIAIMFFAAFVISCSLDPIVTKLEKKMPRSIAATLVMVALILILAAIFIPVCIMSAGQINLFLHKLPWYIDNFDEYVLGLPILKQFNFLANDADNIMEQISLSSSDIITHAMDIGKSIGASFLYLFVSVILIYNMVADKAKIQRFYLKVFPSRMRKKAAKVGGIISDKMGGYLTALLVTTASVGIVMLIGLSIMNVPYALLLAIITAVFDIIPVVGPALALVICLLAAYEAGTGAVISVIVVFSLAQLIENNLVRPYVFSKVMNIHPIVVFLFLFIAAQYIGIVGVVFAPAIAALVAVLFEELYLKKVG